MVSVDSRQRKCEMLKQSFEKGQGFEENPSAMPTNWKQLEHQAQVGMASSELQ